VIEREGGWERAAWASGNAHIPNYLMQCFMQSAANAQLEVAGGRITTAGLWNNMCYVELEAYEKQTYSAACKDFTLLLPHHNACG
jgi:hypothetical protein